MNITRKQLAENVITRFTPHHLFTEASALGLAPTSYPERIDTDLGNGKTLTLLRVDSDRTAHYVQDEGSLELTIFNE